MGRRTLQRPQRRLSQQRTSQQRTRRKRRQDPITIRRQIVQQMHNTVQKCEDATLNLHRRLLLLRTYDNLGKMLQADDVRRGWDSDSGDDDVTPLVVDARLMPIASPATLDTEESYPSIEKDVSAARTVVNAVKSTQSDVSMKQDTFATLQPSKPADIAANNDTADAHREAELDRHTADAHREAELDRHVAEIELANAIASIC